MSVTSRADMWAWWRFYASFMGSFMLARCSRVDGGFMPARCEVHGQFLAVWCEPCEPDASEMRARCQQIPSFHASLMHSLSLMEVLWAWCMKICMEVLRSYYQICMESTWKFYGRLMRVLARFLQFHARLRPLMADWCPFHGGFRPDYARS